MSRLPCFILRNECIADAQFVVTHPGKVLEGAVISRFYHSEEDCQFSCMEDFRCKSINFHDNRSLCELNSKIAGDFKTKFTERVGWKYKTTNFTGKQVKGKLYI